MLGGLAAGKEVAAGMDGPTPSNNISLVEREKGVSIIYHERESRIRQPQFFVLFCFLCPWIPNPPFTFPFNYYSFCLCSKLYSTNSVHFAALEYDVWSHFRKILKNVLNLSVLLK